MPGRARRRGVGNVAIVAGRGVGDFDGGAGTRVIGRAQCRRAALKRWHTTTTRYGCHRARSSSTCCRSTGAAGGVRARQRLPPLHDAIGRSYLDLISGVGVARSATRTRGSLPAIAAQAHELLHTSNLFFHPLQAEVASRLAALSGLPRAFFCNSGTEAVEACLKFARRYWHAQGTPRTRIRRVRALVPRPDDGRAVGDVGRPLPRAVRAAAAGRDVRAADDPAALRRARSRPTTAAVIVEPIQGEGGVRPMTPASGRRDHRGVRATGRCSSPTKCSAASAAPDVRSTRARSGLKPDLMALGKALGAGVPIGAAHVHRTSRREGGVRRSRQHLRRQPARLPRGAGVPRRADRDGLMAHVARSRDGTLEAALRDAGARGTRA